MQTEPSSELKKYLDLRSDFTDFEFFQGDSNERASEKQRFLSDSTYIPEYTYPKLLNLAYQDNVTALKSSLMEASFALASVEKKPEVTLQINYIHSELSRIALTEAARNMLISNSSEAYVTGSESFNRRNLEAYGVFDHNLALSMIQTELKDAHNATPMTHHESQTRAELIRLTANDIHTDRIEPNLLDAKELQLMHEFVINKYADSFSLVPDTDQHTIYDAEQCKRMLEDVLDNDGLSNTGWKIVINDESIIVSTYPKKKIIYIPANLVYTAEEIRRILIGHEIKAHAWRYENALLTENLALEEGTATSADIEEGLGILIECAIAGTLKNPSLDRARDRYITAGLALGADGIKRDAREVYEILWRMLYVREDDGTSLAEQREYIAKQTAYTHIENAFRGTSFARKGVIYTKLKIYYEGLVKNAEFFRERINNLDDAFTTAFIGRYDHTNSEEREFFKTIR